jgi:hypothetical protein
MLGSILNAVNTRVVSQEGFTKRWLKLNAVNVIG